MTELSAACAANSPTGVADEVEGDHGCRLDALRALGAHLHDPVRLRYIEALVRRAAAQRGPVRSLLDRRVAEASQSLAERCRRAEAAGAPAAPRPASPTDHRGPPSALADLVSHLDRSTAALKEADAAVSTRLPSPGDRPAAELKALRQFRTTWTQLSIDRQLSRSLAQAPENPGPFNSHGLMLRSLQVMQDISPAYLRRFVAYADALLWLDQAPHTDGAAIGSSARREADTKRKPLRGKSG